MLGPDFIVRDVLLVEDETLIRMMTAQMVEELGHRVVAEAGNIKDAEPLALNAQFDLAILDINIAEESIYPIALIVEKRGLPLLFASGYGSSGLPEPFCNRSVLRKPFLKEELRRAIDALFRALGDPSVHSQHRKSRRSALSLGRTMRTFDFCLPTKSASVPVGPGLAA